MEAIERMAYEFCLYQADEGVIYAEVRYCPHLLMPQLFNDSKVDYLADSGNKSVSNAQISLSSIVEAVNRGLARGEAEYGIVCRTILSCIRGMPQWSAEILDLCVHFRDHGVVGIDIAGNESGEKPIEGEEKGKNAKVAIFSNFKEIFTICFPEGRMLDPEDIEAYKKAAELGIRRTVHAGEAGPAAMVWKALSILGAERIGHGYRVLEDEKIYRHCLEHKVHFECCPTSSILTGSVFLNEGQVHPIVRFNQDGASFSISTDDPTVTNTKLGDEYRLLKQWGLTEEDFRRAVRLIAN